LLAKFKKNDAQNFTPIIVNLREYRRALNIQQVVTDTLLNHYGVRLPSFLAFERVCAAGNILLVLDGFDEMAERSDRQTLADCFGQIYILAGLNAKVILTCRSNFFKHHADIFTLLKQFSISLSADET
jgi:predicted NACHT family NTPase